MYILLCLLVLLLVFLSCKKTFPHILRFYQTLESSHSGRVRTLGKRVSAQVDQGFESPTLRHFFRFQTIFLCSMNIVVAFLSSLLGFSPTLGIVPEADCRTPYFPTLMYHHIWEYEHISEMSVRNMSVSPAQFLDQIQALKQA